MESTLQELGGILLKAVPTFFLVVLLHLYLKYVFFRPLHRVLHKRYDATEGARKLADESLEMAARKTAEYEEAMRGARAEVYQSQEQLHRKLQEERAAQAREARGKAGAAVKDARALLDADVVQARQALAKSGELLAGQIADSILKRRVA